MEKGSYKLVGIINPFQSTPEVVYPVFLKDNKFFLQVCGLSTKIESFQEVNYEDHLEMIRALAELKTTYGKVEKEYHVGSEAVIALQRDPQSVFVGNMDSFEKYLKQNPVPKGIAYDQIEVLRQDHERTKKHIKTA